MSITAQQSKTYAYTVLKGASGSTNVIAVVKFHRKPEKTKGSGFSLFISVTDPSLEGGRLPCILFNDVKENLPPIQSAGDVIIMRRLIIREFHGKVQGCGYANTGFTAAVFPGDVNAPLVPRLVPSPCSYGESELARVRELRTWFNSPHCPVEREPNDGSASTQQGPPQELISYEHNSVSSSQDPTRISGTPSTPVRRLWSLCPDEFVTIQGQVVSIYRHQEQDRCVVLYLWDGPCITDMITQKSIPCFFGLTEEHLSYLNRSASHNPELAAVTAHRLGVRLASTTDLIDWSVPVFVYDEHASSPPVTELVPGDLVQVNNVHVLRCRPPDCQVPGCMRVIVHGGGHKFARGVQRIGTMQMLRDYTSYLETNQPLPDSLQRVNEFHLLAQLRDGMLLRPCALYVPGSVTVPLTILQLSNLPHQLHQTVAENFDLPFPSCSNPLPHASIPPGSWIKLPDCPESVAKHRTAACVRLMARVRDTCPKQVNDLQNLVLLACSRCQSAVRISCLLDPNEEVCRCMHGGKRRNTSKVLKKFTLIPVVFLILDDPTGSLLLSASGKAALDLIGLHISWDRIVEELIVQRAEIDTVTTDDSTSEVEKLLHRIRSLQHQWLNVLIRSSWRTEWDIGVPAALDDLHMKFELMPFEEPLSTSG